MLRVVLQGIAARDLFIWQSNFEVKTILTELHNPSNRIMIQLWFPTTTKTHTQKHTKKLFKNWKVLIFNFCQHFVKTTDWPISTTGGAKTVFRPKNKFKIFRVLNLLELKYLTRFHGGLSFAIHLCLNWFLQNLANSFSSGEKLKTDKKEFFDNFLKKIFLTGFYQKWAIIDPPYFLASAMVNTCQKVIHFAEKTIITKKIVKNQKNLKKFSKIDFLEKFDICDFQLLRIFWGLYMRSPYVNL